MGKLTKEQLKTMGIVRNIRKNVMNKNWGCMCDGCTNKAINSHLLQRHGVLLDEIKSPKHNFVFHVVKLPFIPIYASATFSFETNCKKMKSESEIWDGAFMHIIPRIADTYIILGTHKSHMNDELDKFISKFSCANKDSIGILLTDMFSQRIENFGMSISLYKSLKQEKNNMFFEFQRQSMFEYNMLLEPGFNLFEGEYWDALFN